MWKARHTKAVLVLILALAATVPKVSGEDLLGRRVDTGLGLGAFVPDAGLAIARVEPGSAAARAGVKAGDSLAGLGGRAFVTGLDARARLAALRAGNSVDLEIVRRGTRSTLRAVFPALPWDAAPGVEFSYEQVRNPRSGLLQRVILSRPRSAGYRLPAVFFMPWLSCDSVEVPKGPRGGIEALLYRIATESGLVLMRVEKPGVGDSEGVCSETDLETELAGNRAGFAALRAHGWVDPTRIVAMGQSFAGGLLPLVAPAADTRGYLFINSWIRTWLERLLEFERLRLEAGGLRPGAASDRMRGLAELYGLVLEGGLTPGEVIRRKPALAEVWEDAPEHQYGRPITLFRQLQSTNVARAWEAVDRPTLAIYGEADLVMHRNDHERVVSLVNRNRPGSARLVIVPGMDHGLSAALPGGREGLPEAVATVVLEWLEATLGPGSAH